MSLAVSTRLMHGEAASVGNDMTKKPTIRQFGIEAAENLVFSKWEPGHEYTKKVTLVNTKYKMMQIRYVPPASNLFSTKHPKPVKISAGTSYSIPITFRPVTKDPVEDRIEVATPDGTFIIPIRATRPVAALTVPDHVFVGLAPAGLEHTASFVIRNVCPVATTWAVAAPAPFQLSPSAGELLAGKTQTVTVTWLPEEAKIYEGICTLKYNSAESGSMVTEFTLEGRSMFPFLTYHTETCDDPFTDPALEFPETFCGQLARRSFAIHNPTDIPAKFVIEQRHLAAEARFSISRTQGVVQPYEAMELRVQYVPHAVDEDATEFFDIQVHRGNSITVPCHGSSTGPDVSLDAEHLNYIDVACGQKVTKSFKICNKSDLAVEYQILSDAKGVFSIDNLIGTLNPRMAQLVHVTFRPELPLHYFRELQVLVLHHTPLKLNLLGNAHGVLRDHLADKVEPVPLMPHHLSNFAVKEKLGIAQFPPSILRTMMQKGELGVNAAGQLEHTSAAHVSTAKDLLYNNSPSRCGSDAAAATAAQDCADVAAAAATAAAAQAPAALMTLSTTMCDFGQCPSGSKKKIATIAPQEVVYTNNTAGEVLVAWMGNCEPFAVEPAEAAVQAGESKKFMVYFKPVHSDKFYAHNLECFASYVEDRQPIQTEDIFFTRPWRLDVNVCGHTFPDADPSRPKLQWSSEEIHFPQAQPGVKAYGSVMVENLGDTTVSFDAGTSAADGAKWVFNPRSGLVKPHSRQLVSLELTVDELGEYRCEVPVVLNGDANEVQRLALVGSVHTPELVLGDEGTVYFPPTLLGSSVTVRRMVSNASLVPAKYHWQVPAGFADIISVEPAEAELGPGERLLHSWTFNAKSASLESCRVPLVLEGPTPTDGTFTELYAVVVGEGAKGELIVEQQEIELETSIVGTPVETTVTLYNPTDTPVTYLLHHDGSNFVSLSHTDGVLPPGSRRKLHVLLNSPGPLAAGQFLCNLAYSFAVEDAAFAKEYALCEISVNFVRPKLKIIDAKASALSKGTLWSMFGITALNKTLGDAAIQETNDESEPYFDLNFDTGIVESEDNKVDLEIANVGDVPAKWSVVFPNDLVYKPEKWSAQQTLTPREEKEKNIIENKIFQVEQRRGTLAPGASTKLRLTYRHLEAGDHQLIVFLRVEGRPELWLNLRGQTLTPGTGFLNLPSAVHRLEPQPIGLEVAPLQHYSLRNSGDEPLNFFLDLSAFEKLKAANYGFPILECDNANGTIEPGESCALPIRFWPIEAKDYQARITITTSTAQEPTLLTINALGYDTRDDDAPPRFTDGRNDIAVTQATAVAGQQAFLSIERLYFGDTVMYSMSRKIIFLRNDSPLGHLLSFKFLLEHHRNVLDIQPATGVVEAGEVAEIRVTFMGNGGAAIYNFDVPCEITDMQLVSNHQHAVKLSQKQQQQSDDHFTFTDAGRTGRGRAGGRVTGTTMQGKRSVRTENVAVAEFPQAVLAPGFQPSYSSNLSLSLCEPYDDAGPVHATTHSMRTATLRGSLKPENEAYRQNQTVSSDMRVFEETLAVDKTNTKSSALPPWTVGQDRPSSATRLQKLTGARTVPVSDTDLRTTKYQALPPILKTQTEDVSQAPPLDPPAMLYLGITASVHNNDATTKNALALESEDQLPSIEITPAPEAGAGAGEPDAAADASHFVDRRMFPLEGKAAPVRVWSESNGEAEAIIDIVSSLLQEVLHDDDFPQLVEDATRNEKATYFYQMPNAFAFTNAAGDDGAGAAVETDLTVEAVGGSTDAGADGAARVESAAASIPDHAKTTSFSPASEDHVPGAVDVFDSRADPLFLALAEECFESIFAGLIDGANKQQTDLTARSRLILP